MLKHYTKPTSTKISIVSIPNAAGTALPLVDKSARQTRVFPLCGGSRRRRGAEGAELVFGAASVRPQWDRVDRRPPTPPAAEPGRADGAGRPLSLRVARFRRQRSSLSPADLSASVGEGKCAQCCLCAQMRGSD